MKYLKKYNESIKHLLKPKSEEDIKIELDKMDSYSKLIKGCEYDVLWLVKQALEEGVDPSINFNIAIETACESGSEEVVEFLLNDERIDPSRNNNNCLWLSSTNGNVGIVKLLLKHKKVDPSNDNNIALWDTYENYSDTDYSDERYAEIIRLLVNDKRIKDKLSKEEYEELWDNVNLDKPISESINVSKYDWEYSRINNKVGKLYYASKYKLSMINLYELSKSLIDFSEKETMLMTIIAISILTKENKEKIKKLFELASSYNITQKNIDNLVNKFTTIKNIFKIVASKYDIIINDMSDLLINTNLLIPFINVLISLIEQQKLNIDILSKPLEEIQKELGEEKYKLMFNRIERKLEIMLLNDSKFKDVKYTEPYKKSQEFKPIHMRTKRITL